MYAKVQCYRKAQSVSWLHQQFVHYLYSSWRNPKCRSIIEQFHKNIPARRKHGDDNGNRKDNVLNMINNQYLDHMYKAWLKDRKSVSSSWDSYFKLIHAESPKDSPFSKPSSIRISSSSALMALNLKGGKSEF